MVHLKLSDENYDLLQRIIKQIEFLDEIKPPDVIRNIQFFFTGLGQMKRELPSLKSEVFEDTHGTMSVDI